MTCALVLEGLLDAEPAELAAEGSSPVAEHLRSCDRCRRLASQLLVDTRFLAVALPVSAARRRASRQIRYASLAPVGLVAALVMVAVLRSPATVSAPVMTAVTEPGGLRQPAGREVPSRVVTSAPARRKPSSRATVATARAYPPAVAITPRRYQRPEPSYLSSPVSASSAVSVDPPAGTRAVVMQTNNPKLVVVWLY